MEQSRLKGYLETGSNIAVVLVAVLIIGVFTWQYFAGKQPSELQSGLHKGANLSQLSGYDFSSSPKTLIIAVHSKCGYCSASIPFYNRVTESLKDKNIVRAIAVFPGSDTDAKQYVEAQGLKTDSVVMADFRALHINNTPTMILVDSKGKIIDFWVGQLTEDKQQQVMKIISAT